MSAVQQVLLAYGASGGSVDPTALSIYNKIATAAGGSGAYWDLTEASGSRADTANAYATMAQSGIVGSSTGPRGGGDVCALFTGAEYLTFSGLSGDATDVPSGGGSHCFFGWVYCNNLSSIYDSGRWDATSSSTMGYLLRINSTTGTVAFFNGGTSYTSCTTAGSVAASTWAFIVGWRDTSTGKVSVCLNNGTVATSAGASNPTQQNRVLCLGSANGYDRLNGRLSRWGYIKGSFLTSTEITWLMNSGSGRNWGEIKTLAGH